VFVVNDVVNVMAAYQPVVQACGVPHALMLLMHGANMKIGRNYLVLSQHLPARSNTAVKMSLKITVL
jgi:hypothetical protein